MNWRNTTTDHDIDRLDGLSPLESWLADATPLQELDVDRLWMFTLEDDRAHRKITTKGVARGRGRHDVADWMVGLVGARVRLRYMPNHDHEVEVFDLATGKHLGWAWLADQVTGDQVGRVQGAAIAKPPSCAAISKPRTVPAAPGTRRRRPRHQRCAWAR
ncbi:hypothetical protein BOX37_28400 [Nocardia mangyaensis]|uniref:Transposase-like Mu C-terminal domain-containing protein n=1 Tax=Nocardia mangyaensis TaxID=2213200 RepID=A0A1J0VYX8_9NOCA|nr:Mu transposase C-terminal domain-containing protein [Nocardia mangyaensis]APE37205.1 hypothetical protein BOX37_28400 [Nocardia mangyaensis]MBC7299411.1 Mu transposase C-terminal domain-containing protein [Nocardia sp.]